MKYSDNFFNYNYKTQFNTPTFKLDKSEQVCIEYFLNKKTQNIS